MIGASGGSRSKERKYREEGKEMKTDASPKELVIVRLIEPGRYDIGNCVEGDAMMLNLQWMQMLKLKKVFGKDVDLNMLKDFHRCRLQVLVGSGHDLVAFETFLNKLEYHQTRCVQYYTHETANSLCAHSLQRYNQCTEKISINNILEPYCDDTNFMPCQISISLYGCMFEGLKIELFVTLFSLMQEDDAFEAIEIWANSDIVQHALNVSQGTFGNWELINTTMHYVEGKNDTFCYSYDIFSSFVYHKKLTTKNCRALIFSGDQDMTFPYVGIERWIASLGVRVEIPWNPYYVDDQVGGYEMTYGENDFIDNTKNEQAKC
ncbi:hypothetical protein R6Q59_002413 [Mikania micrantha]